MKLTFLGFPNRDTYRSSACSLWTKGETREVSQEVAKHLLADHGSAFQEVTSTKKVKKAEVKTEEVKTATVDRSIKRKAKKQ